MKTLLTITIVLLLAQSIQAQIPTPVENAETQSAVLKEWWRADNLGYGVQGMTWLENFYNGQGALVIHTPKGVKTWLLRYPGDTVNVFTWNGNDANIKTGDFNGDGVTDYVDQRGQIYVGIQNGQPPEPLYVRTINSQGPYLNTDFNGDGKVDMINFGVIDSAVTIAFGDSLLPKMEFVRYPIVGINTENNFLHAYVASTGDIRCVIGRTFRQTLPKYPYRRIISVGWTLLGLHWNQATRSIDCKLLADTTWNTPDSTGVYITSQLSSLTGKPEFLLCTMLKGSYWKSMLTTYDLSTDKFRVASHVRCDSVQTILPLRYSLDDDSIPSLCIVRSNPWYVSVFSGSTDDSLKEICSIGNSVPAFWTLAIPKLAGHPRASLVLAAEYLQTGNFVSAITFSSRVDSVSYITENTNSPMQSISVRPLPAQADHLSFSIVVLVSGSYSVELCDINGRRVQEPTEITISAGSQEVTIPIRQGQLASGLYTLRVFNAERSLRQTFTIK